MKHLTLVLSLLMMGSMAWADSYQLQCEFREETHLGGFIAEIDEDTAYLHFSGETAKESRMNPAGERVTLVRKRPFTANWMIFAGTKSFPHLATSGCFIFENGNCVYPSREYSLNFSPATLLRPGERNGSLSFTKISDYVAAEAFYSHDIFCTEIR